MLQFEFAGDEFVVFGCSGNLGRWKVGDIIVFFVLLAVPERLLLIGDGPIRF
jgi:hypothetical protein